MKYIVLVLTLLSYLLLGGLTQAANKAEASKAGKITVYLAKNIVTMDQTNPEATAVAIRDGRILSVGSLESLQPWLVNNSYSIDKQFENNVLFPGLIDPHLHPMLAALQLSMTWITPESWNVLNEEIKAVRTPEKYWQRLAEEVEKDADSSTPIFITWGWSKPEHGPVTRQMLDKLPTDKPIMVWQRSLHEAVYNTAALKWMKLLDKKISEEYNETVDMETGYFMEAGFFEVAAPHISPYLLSPAFIDGGFAKLSQYVNESGVTTVADMAFGGANWDLETTNYQRNLIEKNVPYRTVLVPDAYKLSLQKGGLDKSFEMVNERLTKASDAPQLVHGKRIKMFSDGAMFSLLMQMNEPGYIDGHKGQWITQPEKLLKQARKYWNAGYKIHIHSNGDAGIDNTLDVLEQLQLETPRPPHNLVIEHYGYADDRINHRTAKLGAGVSANPYYHHLLGDSYSQIGLGADRAKRLVPLSGLVDLGVPVTLHSDFGMAPAQPFLLAWAAATRTTLSGRQDIPPRALTVPEALKAITVNAAYTLGLEKDIGSIASGKKADFVVLDVNPFDVKAEQLKDIKILNTIFEGRISQL